MTLLLPDQTPERECYPVLFQLGGEGDDHTTWLRNTQFEAKVRDLPLVVVFPDGGYGRYTDWREHGPAYERYIIEDVLTTVERYFPVIKSRAGRAIGGVSMGGYGAMKLALKYPEMFCSVATHSGSYLTAYEYMPYMEEQRVSFWKHHIFGPNSRGSGEDVFALAARLELKSAPAIYFDCGDKDVLLPAARRFHEHLSELKIDHKYVEHPGEHSWDYWAQHIPDAIDFQTCHLLKE